MSFYWFETSVENEKKKLHLIAAHIVEEPTFQRILHMELSRDASHVGFVVQNSRIFTPPLKNSFSS